MKKTVILILALLPIVLLVVISIAGRILSTYQHIDVSHVVFTDDSGNELDNSASLVLGVGDTKSTNIKIYPELATNKQVSYSSSDESVCTVDSDGNVTGVGAGNAIIMVRTADGNRTAMLNVIVRADSVTGVTLTPDEISMSIGESRDLIVVVEPYAALNKRVTYTISDPSIATVSATGKVTALKAGTATITVTTVDGGLEDTCVITVVDNLPPLYFNFDGEAAVQSGYVSPTNTVDLTAGIKFDETIALEDIRFRIVTGDVAAVDENGVLTFAYNGLVTVEAFVGDPENPTYSTTVRIACTSVEAQ